MKRFLFFAAWPLLAALTGCSTPAHSGVANGNGRIHLTATSISPLDIALHWTNAASDVAGYAVEWTADLKSEYVVLAFLPPTETSYVHPDLMPETTCHYRVRAFYGSASNAAEVNLPKELSDTEFITRYDGPEDYYWAIPRIVGGNGTAAKYSIKNPATALEAAPSDLKAELVPTTVSGFKVTWTDHARDEQGYFLEMKPDWSSDFKVVALVEPNINSFGYAFQPPTRKALVRVRAFYYGKPSNPISKTTGRAPVAP
jgi:hypothetical protein